MIARVPIRKTRGLPMNCPVLFASHARFASVRHFLRAGLRTGAGVRLFSYC
jgi:hypothetical protein